MKVYLLALLWLLSLAAPSFAAGNNQSHSVTWGARLFNDMLLERNIITEKSKLMRVAVRDYEFKPKYASPRITQIVITDRIKYGKGGFATLVAGGPQLSFVKIRFKSQRNRGFNFIVDIYGL